MCRFLFLVWMVSKSALGMAQAAEDYFDEGTEYHGQTISRRGGGLDEAGETDNGVGESELEFSSAESRKLYQRFGKIGLGLSLPWQTAHFENGILDSDSQQARSLFLGVGKFHTSGNRDLESGGKSTRIRSTVFGVNLKRYLSPKWPLFIRGSVYAAQWSCPLIDRGTDSMASEDQVREKKLLAVGVAFDVGGTYVWRNGFYLENTLAGLTYASAINAGSRHVADLAKKQIGNIREWGLFNIALGIMF